MSIEAVYQLGEDALQNHFLMTMAPPVLVPNFPIASLPFRLQTFEVPDTNIGTYEVHYRTQKFERPSGKIDSPTEFTFSFRADRYWNIYNSFKAWSNLIQHHQLGTMTPDLESQIRAQITVMTVDSNNLPTGGGWIFRGAFLKSITGISFDQTSGDPIEVSVTMSYLYQAELPVNT